MNRMRDLIKEEGLVQTNGDRAIEALEKIRNISIEHKWANGEHLFSLNIRTLINWGLGK